MNIVSNTLSAAETPAREQMKIVIVGHVDHGKSTLIGRLLADTGALPEGRLDALRESCKKRGRTFEYSFLLDALQAERSQGITIDTAHIWFSTRARDYVIIDAPGHKEFLKNMVTGAASAEAAVLVVDALEGVREQSRRHGYLLHLLGVRQITVAVNKMDLVDHAQARFEAVAREITDYLTGVGCPPAEIVPIAAREGGNVALRSEKMAWYDGPTLAEALDRFKAARRPVERPLRLPVQDVYKFDQRRIIAGRIESGRLRVGETVRFLPAGKRARISGIEAWGAGTRSVTAEAGQCPGVTLDEQIFVERGAVMVHEDDPAPFVARRFRARIFWLGTKALEVGNRYAMKIGTARHAVTVESIETVVDVGDLSGAVAQRVETHAVAEVVLASDAPVVFDSFADNPTTARFVLVDGYDAVGGGIIADDALQTSQAQVPKSTHITPVAHRVTPERRWAVSGHRGAVIWLTGLSGSGKSTIALELERRLVEKGLSAFVLDGDNLRFGLNADLGFSPQDRAENVRRAGEAAALLADAGVIAVSALISPYRADREKVRAMRPGMVHEVFVRAGLAVCEQRDPKGLYGKARRGEITGMTGLDAPYEAPDSPDLILDTETLSVEEAVSTLLDYVLDAVALDGPRRSDSRAA